MATLTEQLAQAQAAYHSLMIGKSARVFVDSNGERVEYTAVNRDALKAYIADLQGQLAAVTAGVSPIRGPMRSFFI